MISRGLTESKRHCFQHFSQAGFRSRPVLRAALGTVFLELDPASENIFKKNKIVKEMSKNNLYNRCTAYNINVPHYLFFNLVKISKKVIYRTIYL